MYSPSFQPKSVAQQSNILGIPAVHSSAPNPRSQTWTPRVQLSTTLSYCITQHNCS